MLEIVVSNISTEPYLKSITATIPPKILFLAVTDEFCVKFTLLPEIKFVALNL